MRARRGAGLTAVACLVAVQSRSAAALDQGEWQAVARAEGVLVPGDGGRAGAGLGADALWAWRDELALRMAGDIARLGGPGQTMIGGDVGLTYALDAIRWVPFVDAGFSVRRFAGGASGKDHTSAGVTAAAGVDYLLTRQWGLGLQARAHVLPVGADSTDVVLTAGARLSRFFW